MVPYTARIDRSGRLVLPAAIRADLELREGDEVVFLASASPGEIRLMPRQAAVRQGQAIVREHIPKDRKLVEELLRTRRREAAREVGPPTARRKD
jgi:AbrB family looped-hinge helix DNA binding protein